MAGEIATRGKPAPVQASRCWPVERTYAWANQDGKLRWGIGCHRRVVAFWLALATAAIVCGRLVRGASPTSAVMATHGDDRRRGFMVTSESGCQSRPTAAVSDAR
jgi:hypothetical protein